MFAFLVRRLLAEPLARASPLPECPHMAAASPDFSSKPATKKHRNQWQTENQTRCIVSSLSSSARATVRRSKCRCCAANGSTFSHAHGNTQNAAANHAGMTMRRHLKPLVKKNPVDVSNTPLAEQSSIINHPPCIIVIIVIIIIIIVKGVLPPTGGH